MHQSTIYIATTLVFCLLAVLVADDTNMKFFEQQVRPILVAKCVKCHSGGKPKGDLRLTTREHILAGGESGKVVSLNDPAKSLLVEAINYDGLEMPPNGKLAQSEIDVLTLWVKMKLPWPTSVKELAVTEDNQLEPPVNETTKRFWSFQRVKRPKPPKVENVDWVRNPIDAFVLSKLVEAGIRPSPAADQVALLRRAYYDLTGLPPSPKEIQQYIQSVAHDPKSAYEKLIDRLLRSPHYGEKWGRHWLDLVRYAETNSYERDGPKPFVWRYRDYVIKSLNDDKPYDQFIQEQLAGDELDDVTGDSIVATGFYRLGVWQDEPVDPKQELYEDLDDIVRTTGEVFLGLTVGCARCHNHKLDPFPHQDYYRMVAFFRNVRRYGVRAHPTVLNASVREIDAPATAQENAQAAGEHKRKMDNVLREMKKLEDSLRGKLVGGEKDDFDFEANRLPIFKKHIGKGINQQRFNRYENFTRQLDDLRKNLPRGKANALCVKEHGRSCPPTHVLTRGNAHAPAEEVSPGFPSVLGFEDPSIAEAPSGVNSSGRRRALAQWIASAENPLTSRVMANRLWQYHFGRGIVRSPNNFGFQGDRPTHPKLLDWLASELVSGGWKLKRMHKLIMMSNTYQMSSRANDMALTIDPENNLFWRQNMRRLTAEEIRDSIFAVNGKLNRKLFGPSFYPVIPDEVKAGQSRPGAGWGNSSPEERARRSIYIHVKRSLVVPMIAAFDGPDVDTTCPVRFVTTQPTQSLGMLNGPFMNEQARVFADYVRSNAEGNKNQVEMILSRALQRKPDTQEVERGLSLLDVLQKQHKVDANKALDHYCLVVLNLNEFVYLD